jgi:hypothetical protein
LNTASIIWRTRQTVSGLFEAKPSYGKDGDVAALENAQSVSHFAHSSGDRDQCFKASTLFCDKPDVETHADSLGVSDESPHVDVLGPSLGAAELRRAGADLLG